MKYNQPFDQTNPDAPYIDGNPATSTPGSIPRAAAIEAPQREIVYAIAQSGQTPSVSDNTQLWKAIQYSASTGGGSGSTIITNNVLVGGRVLFFKIVAGSYTWTCPGNVTLVRIRAVAGGGGGGNGNNYAGAGGLGGNFFEGTFDVTPGTTYSIVVGAGGASGGGPSGGGNGGLTSFGVQGGATLAVALGGTGGGAGGNSATGFVGVAGASPGYSNISFPHGGFELLGYGAQNGIYYQVGSANIMQGGMGGGAPFFASTSPYPVGNGSFNGTGCGGGASGGAGASVGGLGAAGAIFIEG